MEMPQVAAPDPGAVGTDLTRLTETRGITYRQSIEHFTDHMGLSEQQLDWVMGKGICQCLDWPATATPMRSERRATA